MAQPCWRLSMDFSGEAVSWPRYPWHPAYRNGADEGKWEGMLCTLRRKGQKPMGDVSVEYEPQPMIVGKSGEAVGFRGSYVLGKKLRSKSV
jgi:hypothetical protein